MLVALLFLVFLLLGWFNLVQAVFLCDHTTGCEAHSFMTDGYGIFNVRTHLGTSQTYEGGSGQTQTNLHKS